MDNIMPSAIDQCTCGALNKIEASISVVCSHIGNSPSRLAEHFQFPPGFEWLNLDYDIIPTESYAIPPSGLTTVFHGIIYDTFTGHTIWRGNTRRRQRDAERLTKAVLAIFEAKLGA